MVQSQNGKEKEIIKKLYAEIDKLQEDLLKERADHNCLKLAQSSTTRTLNNAVTNYLL